MDKLFWNRANKLLQENLTGILGTVAFHLVLAIVFLTIRITAERTQLESMIMLEFEDDTEQEPAQEDNQDSETEMMLAQYLEEHGSNIPVNVANQLDEQLSTERYVDEIKKELDAGRSDESRELEERLKELEESEQGDLIAENNEKTDEQTAEPYQGPTNINYSLEFRYHLRLPVPVYQCIGEGVVEVKIAVDQMGRVVQAEVDKPGEGFNEICLAEAARKAALQSRFNTDFDAPVRQQGTITYHFIAQ